MSAKKTPSKGKKDKPLDLGRLAREAKEAGRSTWLAGLGAFAKVGEEGRSLFDHLVEQGRGYEKRRVEPLAESVSDGAGRIADGLKDFGTKVQGRVETLASGTLHRLGVPTHQDIAALTARVEALAKKLDRADAR